MASYITKTYLENMFSPAQIERVLSYGDFPTASYQTKVDQYISGSESEINGYLKAGGYDLPLNYVPEVIKQISAYLTMNNLAAASAFDMGDYFKEVVSSQYFTLGKIRDKVNQLEGVEQNTQTGIGGNLTSEGLAPNGGTCPNAVNNLNNCNGGLIFSKSAMRGYFY